MEILRIALKVLTTVFLLIAIGVFLCSAGKGFEKKGNVAGNLVSAFFMLSAAMYMWG